MKKTEIDVIPPGEILKNQFMLKHDLSTYALAKAINVPISRIQEIIKNKRVITIDTSVRLGKLFGLSPYYFIDLQNKYDSYNPSIINKEDIKKINCLISGKPNIFISDIKNLDETSYSRLTTGRKEKADSISNDHARKLSILAGLLLNEALGDKAKEIKIGENGKPYLSLGPYFSISHSGDKAVVVTSKYPIGVDLQFMKEPDYSICEKFFSDSEKNINNKEEFYKAWTSKEAYMKASGSSLITSLRKDISKIDEYQIIKSKIVFENYYLTIVEKLK